MNPNTQKRGDELIYGGWLVIDAEGSMALRRREPALGRGEIAVSLVVKVPLSLFRKPLLRAEVVVPPAAGVSAAEAIRAVVDVIQEGCAFEVEVSEKGAE